MYLSGWQNLHKLWAHTRAPDKKIIDANTPTPIIGAFVGEPAVVGDDDDGYRILVNFYDRDQGVVYIMTGGETFMRSCLTEYYKHGNASYYSIRNGKVEHREPIKEWAQHAIQGVSQYDLQEVATRWTTT